MFHLRKKGNKFPYCRRKAINGNSVYLDIEGMRKEIQNNGFASICVPCRESADIKYFRKTRANERISAKAARLIKELDELTKNKRYFNVP